MRQPESINDLFDLADRVGAVIPEKERPYDLTINVAVNTELFDKLARQAINKANIDADYKHYSTFSLETPSKIRVKLEIKNY